MRRRSAKAEVIVNTEHFCSPLDDKSVSVPQFETTTCYYTVQIADQSILAKVPQVSTSLFECELTANKKAMIYDGDSTSNKLLAT